MEDRKEKSQNKILRLKEKLQTKYMDEDESQKFDDLDKVALYIFLKHRNDKEVVNQLNETMRQLTFYLLDYSNK